VAGIAIRRLKVPFSCRRIARAIIRLKSSGTSRTVEPVHLGCKHRGVALSGVDDDGGGRTETGYRPSPLVGNASSLPPGTGAGACMQPCAPTRMVKCASGPSHSLELSQVTEILCGPNAPCVAVCSDPHAAGQPGGNREQFSQLTCPIYRQCHPPCLGLPIIPNAASRWSPKAKACAYSIQRVAPCNSTSSCL
jgi:hypothetical protein